MENLLKNIKKLRKEQKITQREMAYKLGLSQPNYANFESGKIEISLSRLMKLTEILNVSIGELLGIDNNSVVAVMENSKELESLRKENWKLKDENVNLQLTLSSVQTKIITLQFLFKNGFKHLVDKNIFSIVLDEYIEILNIIEFKKTDNFQSNHKKIFEILQETFKDKLSMDET